MSIFKSIWEFLKKLWRAIVDYFNPVKKPTVKITILTLFILSVLLPSPALAQRTEVQAILVYFYQPFIENNDLWTVRWHNGVADSVDILKNDSLRVKIRNELGEWVNYIDIPQEMDTSNVVLKVSRPYGYDIEFTFDLIARDTLGISSDPSDSVKVYFMVSDINKVIEPDVDRGWIRGDDSIDGLDLIELSKMWGRSGVGNAEYADINGDTYIDGLDLIQMAKDWGRTWSP